MLTSICQTITRYHLITPGDAVVIGLSGGADSVALLHALIKLRERYHLRLSATHVNHGLREAAATDENFVTEICRQFQIPLRIFHIDVRRAAKGQTIEEAARHLRYACFETVLREQNASKAATAHNRDDQAETVLLNLIRGAGLKGLCGIPPIRALGEGRIIRPMLETSRDEIEAYLHENNLPFRTDASNADETYRRNRVRHSLLPLIKAHINPHAPEVIARNTIYLRDDEMLLEELTQEAYTRCLCDDGLSITNLLALPPAIKQRVIRKAIGFQTNLHATHMEQALDLLEGGTGREICLPTGVRVRREYDRLLIFQASDLPHPYCYPLTPEQSIFVPEINKTALLTFNKPNQANVCSFPFAYDKVYTALFLRIRRPGDRIFINGVGTRKLKDYFIDKKIPRSQRDALPLLADGNQILLIADHRFALHVPESLLTKGSTVGWLCLGD